MYYLSLTACVKGLDTRSSIMFKQKSTKSTILMAVALIIVVAVLLTACNGDAFKPVTMPAGATPESNGGNAIKYGEWIYYVNGYQSSNSAENTYTQINARVGAIARIKIADIEKLFDVYEDSDFTTSTARTKEIARLVAENAEIVVPNFYYSGNTTTTQLNGIYIFDDRIYILTPNDELTAGGNSQASQSVLTSYKLDGSNPVRHYVFTNNSAQILLDKVGGKLIATYIMGSEVGYVDVAAGSKSVYVEETTSAQFDVADKAVVYLNKDGSICKLSAGAAEAKTLVKNEKEEGVDHTYITYAIVSANAGYVYYTKSDSSNSSVDKKHVYYATEQKNGEIALATEELSSNWYGYKETFVYAKSETVNGVTLYGVWLAGDNKGLQEGRKQIVDPEQNDTSITFNRIEGDWLYYTTDNVAYKVDLSQAQPAPVAIGRSLASASGWSVPDMIDNYVITLSSGSVSVGKFDAKTMENGKNTVTITIVEPTTED